MTKRLLLLSSILAPALLLGGCMGTENRGLESVHQPVVARSDYMIDLAAGPAGLARGEPQRLAGWLATMHLHYGDAVAVDDPTGSPAVRSSVASAAGRYGLLLANDVPVTAAPIAAGTVRVVISRMHASVPGCPDYSRDPSVDYNANTSSNHGCAVNSNLAAMVANPTDLVRGQSGAGVDDPAVNYRAIDAYRRAAPSGSGGTAVKADAAGGK